jgi:hypothetical protein
VRGRGEQRHRPPPDNLGERDDAGGPDHHLRAVELDQRLLQSVVGAGGYPAQDVAAPGDGVRLDDAGYRLKITLDRVDGPLGDLEGDEGLDAEARRRDVDVGPVAGHDPVALESVYPGGHGRPGHAENARQLEGAGVRPLPQRVQDGQVERVKGRSGSHLAVRLHEIY